MLIHNWQWNVFKGIDHRLGCEQSHVLGHKRARGVDFLGASSPDSIPPDSLLCSSPLARVTQRKACSQARHRQYFNTMINFLLFRKHTPRALNPRPDCTVFMSWYSDKLAGVSESFTPPEAAHHKESNKTGAVFFKSQPLYISCSVQQNAKHFRQYNF